MGYAHAERNLALIRQLEAETRELLGTFDQLDREQSAWLQEVTSPERQAVYQRLPEIAMAPQPFENLGERDGRHWYRADRNRCAQRSTPDPEGPHLFKIIWPVSRHQRPWAEQLGRHGQPEGQSQRPCSHSPCSGLLTCRWHLFPGAWYRGVTANLTDKRLTKMIKGLTAVSSDQALDLLLR